MRILKENTEPTASGVLYEGSVDGNESQALPVPDDMKMKTTTGLTVEGIQYVNTKFELTPEIKEELKSLYGKNIKKLTLMGHDFVFRIFSREEWEGEIDDWRASFEKQQNKLLTDEEIDRQLIETALVFPGISNIKRMNAEFFLPAEFGVYLGSLPAGIQPRLARYIEHHSGFFIAELVKDNDELFAEDISDAYEESPRPPKEELDKVKELTDLPIRLVRACGEWYALRALKWSELKAIRTKAAEGTDGDFEVKILQKTILVGPKSFDEQPAGIVPFLYAHLKQISGLDMEGPDVFATEAEDL